MNFFEFMAKFELLERFRFKLNGDYDQFRKKLQKKWEGIYKEDKKSVKLTRRW